MTYQYLQESGVIVADTESVLTDVQNEYLAVFGADMNTDSSTPQGVLIATETSARKAVINNNVDLANQINPNIAGGVFLDAICQLTGLQRSMGTPSTISGVTVTGIPNTIIPEGSQAKTGAGDLFQTTGTVIIPLAGTTTADFASVENGAIPAAANTLTTIVSGVLGWETVTNPNPAVLGTSIQSDESLRALRRNTLAIQGVALVEAITSALYATAGVKSLQFRENVASTTQVIDGITMVSHSIWACVDGGEDSDVAAALLNNKSNGCGYNGSTSVNITEPISGQVYAVTFDRPTPVPVLCKITVKVAASLQDPTTDIQAAIMAYVNGTLPYESGFAVGVSVSPFELAAAANYGVPGIYVQKCEVTYASLVSWQTTELAIAINEIATMNSGNITVVLI